MRSFFLISVVLGIIFPVTSAPIFADTVTILASYELSETDVTVTSGEVTITRLPGGTTDGTYGAVPDATEASYVLGLIWTGQPDRKVEIRHDFTTTFDLDNADFILVDCYFPVESAMPIEPDGIIGIWDDVFGWLETSQLPWTTDVWFTVQLDVTGLSNTGLDHISALIWENMGSDGDSSGTIFIDNLRLIQLDPPNEPNAIIAAGHDSRIDLRWDPVTGLGCQGSNI